MDAAGDKRVITTEIAPALPFYYAEDDHQQYLFKNPEGYCGLGGIGVCLPPQGLIRCRPAARNRWRPCGQLLYYAGRFCGPVASSGCYRCFFNVLPFLKSAGIRRHVWIDYVKQYFTDSFLIAVSAFFSLSEISLAASRKIKLKLMADEGASTQPECLNCKKPGHLLHRGRSA